ncbi:MAG: gamma carbonic anhydrase family protein [Candidatus Thermoplasmatota archaeon]
MTLYEFEGRKPKIDESSYVAESADIIGDVSIGKRCFIAPGAKIKGDYGEIKIGDETSVQENCIVHARPNESCVIGSRVTVGHGAILHNCTIGDSAVIGMGAIVSDWAELGEWSVVGEGAVVTQNQKIPANKIAVGVPAKLIGEVNEEFKAQWNKFKDIYAGLAERRYKEGLKKITIL